MKLKIEDILMIFKSNEGKNLLEFNSNDVKFGNDVGKYSLVFSNKKEGLNSIDILELAKSDLLRGIKSNDSYRYICVIEGDDIRQKEYSFELLSKAYKNQTYEFLYFIGLSLLLPACYSMDYFADNWIIISVFILIVIIYIYKSNRVINALKQF